MSNRPVAWVKLEEEAYYAVLRALAVNELNWEKEKLLTDLRTILHITNDQHFKFLEEVMGDKLVTRLRSSVANAEQNPNQAATNTMPPPPPRQQTPATANNTRNKPRPNSAGAKFPANNSPAQARSHRLSESAIDRRGRGLKASHSVELKRIPSGSKAGRGLVSQRSRGRGRRITALSREIVPEPAAPQLRAPRKMFSQAALKKVMEAGSEQELQAIFQELQAQDRTIEQHINLIDQMEDDTLADRDPGKYCLLAIDELEMALEMYEAEEKMLESSDEDGA